MGITMATFENIQEGDLVLSLAEVRISWGVLEHFKVASPVIRVTPHQFQTALARYKKTNGTEIGGHGKAHPYVAEQDQTEAYKKCEQKVKLANQIQPMVQNLNRLNAMTLEDLQEIHELLLKALKPNG